MIIKVSPDKEKVKSIVKLTETREKFVSQINKEEKLIRNLRYAAK